MWHTGDMRDKTKRTGGGTGTTRDVYGHLHIRGVATNNKRNHGANGWSSAPAPDLMSQAVAERPAAPVGARSLTNAFDVAMAQRDYAGRRASAAVRTAQQSRAARKAAEAERRKYKADGKAPAGPFEVVADGPAAGFPRSYSIEAVPHNVGDEVHRDEVRYLGVEAHVRGLLEADPSRDWSAGDLALHLGHQDLNHQIKHPIARAQGLLSSQECLGFVTATEGSLGTIIQTTYRWRPSTDPIRSDKVHPAAIARLAIEMSGATDVTTASLRRAVAASGMWPSQFNGGQPITPEQASKATRRLVSAGVWAPAPGCADRWVVVGAR